MITWLKGVVALSFVVVGTGAALPGIAAALEAPENMPALSAGESRTWTSKNVGSLEWRTSGIEPVVCTGEKGEGTETLSKPPTGLFHITWENCTTKVLGTPVKCTGLGDPENSGNILVLGTWVLTWDRKKGGTFTELTTATVYFNEIVHFVCSGVLVEILRGETVCLDLKATESNVTHEHHCLGPATGTEPQEEWALSDATPVWHVPVLKAGVNHPTEHSPFLVTGLLTWTYPVKIEGLV